MDKPVEKEVPRVVKLSGCIYLEDAEYDDEPAWWKEAKGKIYFDENFNAQ